MAQLSPSKYQEGKFCGGRSGDDNQTPQIIRQQVNLEVIIFLYGGRYNNSMQ